MFGRKMASCVLDRVLAGALAAAWSLMPPHAPQIPALAAKACWPSLRAVNSIPNRIGKERRKEKEKERERFSMREI